MIVVVVDGGDDQVADCVRLMAAEYSSPDYHGTTVR
jgi:hypothetical protein